MTQQLLQTLAMQTRFHDSSEPGPPHGWLDGGRAVATYEQAYWENIIPFIRQALRTLVGTGREVSAVQFWGILRLGGRWWIYRVIPAESDGRSDRPGRTLAVIFCAKEKDGVDWVGISAVAPELEKLANDPSHLALLLNRLESSRPGASLTDKLFKQPSTLLYQALKSEIDRSLDGLEEGWHEYFTTIENGSVSKREREEVYPNPPSLPSAPKPHSETPSVAAPIKPPPSSKLTPMKIFTHVLCLIIGLLLGFILHGVSEPKIPAGKEPPKVRTDQDAISHLRAVTDYLNQRSRPTSSDELEPQLQNRSSNSQNPRN